MLSGTRLQFGEDIPSQIRKLYATCFEESPAKRPGFSSIVSKMDVLGEEVVYASLDSVIGTPDAVSFNDVSSFRNDAPASDSSLALYEDSGETGEYSNYQ
jgi:hypothetical protein